MPPIVIRIDTSGFNPLLKHIEKLEQQIPRAIAQGLNEGGDKVRTQVMKTLWRQTGLIKYKSVTSRIRTARAFGEGSRNVVSRSSAVDGTLRYQRSETAALTYQIIVPGKPFIPIEEWPLKVTTGPGGGVDVKTWGVDHLFKRSFQMHPGVLRARTTALRFPVRQLHGPSLAKELLETKGRVPAVFYTTASAEVSSAILKKLARIL